MSRIGVWTVLWAVCAGCAHERAVQQPTRETEEPAEESVKEPVKEPVKEIVAEKTPPPTTKAEADHQLYDGSSGAAVSMPAFAESVRVTDLIGFGELHANAVGSRMQLELLMALAEQKRPIALAMEFFERDTQEFVDKYLAGEITEEQFVDWSRQKKAYATSHRPLIEFCKENRIPVIAANAPRNLVQEYRRLKYDYAEYRETLSEDELTYLPAESTGLNDDEKEHFREFMGGHGEEGRDLAPLMKSMALWDDSMADSVASFRIRNPRHRVLLIVGMFHVMKKMGTVRKFVARRPDDSVRTLIMVFGDASLGFAESDKGLGDVVLKVAPSPEPAGATE